MSFRLGLLFALSISGFAAADAEPPSKAANTPLAIVEKIGIDQKPGGNLPLDLSFRDEEGRSVRLRDYFGRGPVIVAPVYYKCPSLCGLVMSGVFRALSEVKLDTGKEYSVVFVSINPEETPELAAAKKRQFMKAYQRPESGPGFAFLTGDQSAITTLTASLGFRYTYDDVTKQYAHPGMFVVGTPTGVISRYHIGVEYPPKDVRLSLVEASGNRIGTIVDHFVLYCFRYDPASGKYGFYILRALQIGVALTAIGLVLFLFFLSRSNRRRQLVMGFKTS